MCRHQICTKVHFAKIYFFARILTFFSVIVILNPYLWSVIFYSCTKLTLHAKVFWCHMGIRNCFFFTKINIDFCLKVFSKNPISQIFLLKLNISKLLKYNHFVSTKLWTTFFFTVNFFRNLKLTRNLSLFFLSQRPKTFKTNFLNLSQINIF